MVWLSFKQDKKKRVHREVCRSLPKNIDVDVGWWYVTEEPECAEKYEDIKHEKVFGLDTLDIVYPVYRWDVTGSGDILRTYHQAGGFSASDVLIRIRAFYSEQLRRKEVEKVIQLLDPNDSLDHDFIEFLTDRLRKRILIQRKDLLDGLTFFEGLTFDSRKNAYYLGLTT